MVALGLRVEGRPERVGVAGDAQLGAEGEGGAAAWASIAATVSFAAVSLLA